MLGSAGCAGSAGVESPDDADETCALMRSTTLRWEPGDAVASGIPEPSVERWDAEGRFGVAGRPELEQHRSGASLFGRVRRAPFRPGS